MDVRDALAKRKSVRAFLYREVSTETINRILDAECWAFSGVNTQPWQVAVVRGDTKQVLQERLENTFIS